MLDWADRAPALGQMLQRVLTVEEVARMEELTLQRTLDRMVDLVYCPRCSMATIEDSTHCAQHLNSSSTHLQLHHTACWASM